MSLRPFRRFLAATFWLAAAAVAFAPQAGGSEGPTPDSAPASTQAHAPPPLADLFEDRYFGYALRPPEGCRADLVLRDATDGGQQLVEFVHTQQPWLLTVALHRLEAALRPAELLELRAVWRTREDRTFERTAFRATRIDGHAAARMSALYVERGEQLLWQEAIVELSSRAALRLTFKAPASQQAVVAPLFDAILDSVRILRPVLPPDDLERAFDAGRRLLETLPNTDLTPALIPQRRVLFSFDGHPAGFAVIREFPEQRAGKSGVRISERGWLFLEDGTAHRIRNDFFLSADLASEIFEFQTIAVPPPSPDGRVAVGRRVEQGVREHDRLVLAYSRYWNDADLTNVVLRAPPGYLPQVLQRLLPRMLNDQSAGPFAFLNYQPIRKGLVVRIVRRRPRHSGETPAEAAWVVEQWEGLAAEPARTYLTPDGSPLRTEGTDRLVRPTSEEEIRRLFGPRVSRAEHVLTEQNVPDWR